MKHDPWDEIEKWLNQFGASEEEKESTRPSWKELEIFYKEICGWEAVPIPQEYYSCYSKEAFCACTGCEKDLFSPPQMYEIQKVYKGKEAIFEYALCEECGQNLLKEYSKESLKAIEKYFLENMKPDAIDEECRLCKKEKKSLYEYSIMSLNHGTEMYYDFLLCGSCLEGMAELLSEKTKKAISDFTAAKFPGIPADFSPLPVFQI
ncbi:MAG: hypothetical protein HUU50_19585 [Candidatus Brocadiae bacterium]|nr:hypothetical protein [Candidatus Brocadiia bacterium]